MKAHPQTITCKCLNQPEIQQLPYQTYRSRACTPNCSGPLEYSSHSPDSIHEATQSQKRKSAMRYPYLKAVFMVITTTYTYYVPVVSGSSLRCDSNCAACWLNGDRSTGVDTKFSCKNGRCGDSCPSGYGWLHCAKAERCR